MRIAFIILTAAFVFSAASPGIAGVTAQEHRNEVNAIALYDAAINEKDFDKASRYLGSHYIQHSPTAADGIEGLKTAISYLKQNLPDMHAEIKHVYVDGNFVILHVFTTFKPGDRGSDIVDIIRFDRKGKAVEHWDVTQAIPEQLANGNGVF